MTDTEKHTEEHVHGENCDHEHEEKTDISQEELLKKLKFPQQSLSHKKKKEEK